MKKKAQLDNLSLAFLKGGSQSTPPSCALFESAGDIWQLQCVNSIKEYLKEKLPSGILVIG